MSFDDDLRTGLDDAAELLPIDQTVALAAAKSQGRKGVRKRRVLATSGGVLTASALLVGALSLAQDSSPDSVVADETEPLRSVCDGAYPTVDGLDSTRFEAVDETTWTVDGHTLVLTDAHQLDRENLIEGESRHVWFTVGAGEREVWRTLYAASSVAELGFAGMHLPAGCDVVVRLDAGIDQGGRLVLEEFEQRLVWPVSAEPEPVLVSDPDPICGVVAPFQSAELDTRFGAPETALGPDGQLTLRWADDLGTVEVRHPAGPDAVETVSVAVHRGEPSCDTAAVITSGDVSPREARDVLRPVDPDLVDVDTRLGTGVQTSSAVQVNPDAASASTTVPTTTAPTGDTTD
jgi:hypothetical protein